MALAGENASLPTTGLKIGQKQYVGVSVGRSVLFSCCVLNEQALDTPRNVCRKFRDFFS